MIGSVFGLLTVVSETRVGRRKGRFFVCRCACGAERVVYGGHLRAGSTKGCGGACARRESHVTHGMSRTPEFRAWESAKARCYLPTNQRYAHYGARGITMCDAWRESFAAFFADMGSRPAGTSLDRKDNDGPYEPENCRWATPVEQNNNRNFNRRLMVAGVSRTVAEASRLTGIPHPTILKRLYAGKTDEEAIRG